MLICLFHIFKPDQNFFICFWCRKENLYEINQITGKKQFETCFCLARYINMLAGRRLFFRGPYSIQKHTCLRRDGAAVCQPHL